MIDWLAQQFETNQLFTGLVGASSVGAALYAARSVPLRMRALFLRTCSVSVVVHNDDEAFAWINEWLGRQPYAGRARRLQLSTFYGDGREHPMTNDPNESRWTLAPGPGLHWFFYRNRLLLVERQQPESPGGGQSMPNGRRFEILLLRLFTQDVGLVRQLVADARRLRDGDDRLEIYRYSDFWQLMARKLPRPLDTITIPDLQKTRIVADAERFFANASWYAARGVPWRRGYLFEGPPGTGKTSMALALASHFDRPLYALNLGSLLSDDALINALAAAPSRAILLIEDIDGAEASFSRSHAPSRATGPGLRAAKAPQPLTMSALLNAIDGAFAMDGRLLILTTNRPEALDAALLRSGRVDLREHFGPAGTAEARAMFRRFHPDYQPSFELAQPMPAAEVQGILLSHVTAEDAAAALAVRHHEKGPR